MFNKGKDFLKITYLFERCCISKIKQNNPKTRHFCPSPTSQPTKQHFFFSDRSVLLSDISTWTKSQVVK